jgi:hypothetical protein
MLIMLLAPQAMKMEENKAVTLWAKIAPHPHGQVLPQLWIILTVRTNNNVTYMDMGRLSDNIMDGICHVIPYQQFRYKDTVMPVFFLCQC